MNFRVPFACLLIATSIVRGQAPLNSEQLYQQAYDSFVKRDYNSASASLDKINGVDQKKADVLNLRGAIYKRLGELDNAANAYNDALKINPKDWVPKYNLAEVNFLREQYKSSRTFLEQALASMPEADRLQKQDLILYKVYLTYLLQGDEDKAKLLLDSFDVNSANPVYYFSQAAWSFKKKDIVKAKTWVDSTEGLYSADLRNSYSQALVDVGWLEPASGVAAAETATPKPSATPEMVALASPTPVTPAAPDLVPLASSSASPVAMATPSPTETAAVAAAASPSATPADATAAVPSAGKPQKTAPVATILGILAILGIAAIALINLARRSRIVPEPVDNTGYAAIAASSDPAAASLGSHSSEGTGVVMVQEDDSAPAPIKIMPIQREYATDEPVAPAALAPIAVSTSRRSGKGGRKTAPAPAPSKTVSKGTRKAIPLESAPAAAPVAPTRKKPAPKSTPKTVAPVTAVAPASRRTKMVPIPSINVPAPEETQRKRIVVSEIEKMVVKKPASRKGGAARTSPAPAPESVAPPAAALATAAAKKPASRAKTAAPKARPSRPATPPQITIPEFEETSETPPTRTVLRLAPDENSSAPEDGEPRNS